MKQKRWTKAGAAVLALMLAGSALPAVPGGFSLEDLAVTASAANQCWFDAETGTLHLAGTVERENYDLISGSILLPEGVTKADVLSVIAEEGTVLPENCNALFSKMYNATEIDLSKADTSHAVDMSLMFYQCTALKKLNLSGFQTSNVRMMSSMFGYCNALPLLDLSSFDTSNVEQMGMMFEDCFALTGIVVSDKWSTEKVYGNLQLFSNCNVLVGGNGTVYDASNNSVEFARIDREGAPGYFTAFPFNRVSLSLTDDLVLNFYADSVTAETASDYKVIFTGKCEEKGKDTALTEKPGGFCASANVSAVNMNETITAQLYRKTAGGWVKLCTRNYSVYQYLLDTRPDQSWTKNQKNAFWALRETVAKYCQVSHAYFDPADTLPEVIDYRDAISAIDPATGRQVFEPSFTPDEAAISLVLNAKLAARLYVKDLAANETAQFGDETLTSRKARDGRYYFEITGIKATQLADPLTVSYGGRDYTFAPLSWSLRVFRTVGVSERDRAMANILYEYSKNARMFAEA